VSILAEVRKRDAYLDIVKGVAIIAVAFGHCIQFGSGAEFLKGDFFYNDVFRFIYSWHMPLFMLVSGYLFSFSVNRHDWSSLLKSRFKQLLLPMLSWSLLIAIVLRTLGGDISPFLNSVGKHFLNDIWFLWAIFYNSIVVLLVRRYLADRLGVYLVLFILTFVTPDILNAGLYKFMYPFFVTAYLYGAGKLPWLSEIISRFSQQRMLMVVIVIYGFLFSMYGYYAYIYTSGYVIGGFRSHTIMSWKFWNDMYRMLIGFTGSAMIMLLLRLAYDSSRTKLGMVWKMLQKIGIASLAIYIISGYMNGLVLPKICGSFELDYAVTLLESVVVIIICYGVFWLIRKQDYANRFLLGGR